MKKIVIVLILCVVVSSCATVKECQKNEMPKLIQAKLNDSRYSNREKEILLANYDAAMAEMKERN